MTKPLPDKLRQLEHETKTILLHTYLHFGKIGMLWSMGKDSTTLLWILRKLFSEEIPFPLFHIDTSYKLPEMIQFRDTLQKKWNLPLHVYYSRPTASSTIGPHIDRLECCTHLKTLPLQKIIHENQLEALLVGIRRDEEGSRSKEKVFSLRRLDGKWDHLHQEIEVPQIYPTSVKTDRHYRVHPLLSWTELDIWTYIQLENIPHCDLYLSQNKERYRSLGCAPCTKPVASTAANLEEIRLELSGPICGSERAGREQDKASRYGLEKLRVEGYM